ncbi:MAG: hypothetical protein ACR2NP_13090 [Pirellulaceae bacterium]
MNLVRELEAKLDAIREHGYEVHFDWFGGSGGGACQVGNRRCLFLDLAVSADEHLSLADELLQQLHSHDDRAAA